jgi:hypothetical protein
MQPTWSFNNTMLKLLPDNLTYKVLVRSADRPKSPYRTFKEFEDLEEAFATAARLQKNLDDVDVIVEMPDGALHATPYAAGSLSLTA